MVGERGRGRLVFRFGLAPRKTSTPARSFVPLPRQEFRRPPRYKDTFMLAGTGSLSELHSQASQRPIDLCVRTVRPSLLDQRFSGDPWIVDRGSGLFALCLGNYPVAWIDGLSFDLPSLNHLFHHLRYRRPRRRRPNNVRFVRISTASESA